MTKTSTYWKNLLDNGTQPNGMFASADEYETIKFRYWDAIRQEQCEQKNPTGFWHSVMSN